MDGAPEHLCRCFEIDIFVVLSQHIAGMENGLHNRIAVLRAERRISRQELADALGVNYQTIGFLERGDYNPSLKLAMDLSAFFKLPIEAIFSREPFQPLSEVVYGGQSPSAATIAGRNRRSA
jgi:DNA-binding XRE family transcriptional regulator